jgi:DNA-directed RNA polymerase subunit omega
MFAFFFKAAKGTAESKWGDNLMARVTVEDCLNNVDSRFSLVHLAVRRVLQLRGGAPLMLENTKGNKEVVMALREIAANKITIDTIRQIDETRPAPVEQTVAERDTTHVELKEILDEATAFSPSIEFEGPGEFLEPEQEQDREMESDEE